MIQDYDPYIISKLRAQSVIEYIIRIGVDGLKRVIENNGFTESDKVQKELKDYELQNNPILLFLQDKEDFQIENRPAKDVYAAYRVFCVENGFFRNDVLDVLEGYHEAARVADHPAQGEWGFGRNVHKVK